DVNGGSLLHEQSGNVYSYSTVDMQGDTITLTAPLGSGLSFADGDMLYIYPLSSEARAVVALADSADEAPVDVRVTHSLRALLAEGVRAPGTGESVIVEQVESELVATDLSGEIPQLEIDATSFVGDDFVINSDGAFFYSATPAAGNLVASISSSSGTTTDDYGNSVIQGLVAYGGTLAGQLFNSVLAFFATNGHPFNSPPAVAASGDGSIGAELVLSSGAATSAASTADMNMYDSVASPDGKPYIGVDATIHAQNATWQGLGSGTGVSGFTATNSRYLVLPTGFVHVDLRVNFSSAGAGPIVFAN